jgi:hypothetical protein
MAEMGKGPSALKVPLKELDPMEKVIGFWNGVVDGLELTKKNWEAMQQELGAIPREKVQLAPMEVQKAVARFRKAKFEVMLERFVAHYRAFGGLEAMKVKKGGAR